MQPELSLVGGAGVPGGTVSVTLALADDDDNAGISAGIDLRFPDDLVEFFTPVSDNCTLDPRIAGTHEIGGRILEPGVLNIEIFVAGTPDPLPPLGNGNLAVCEFRVKDGAPVGTAPVEIESPFLGDSAGMEIPVRTRDGLIEIILEPPTATPTATGTPVDTGTATATATATGTQPVTSTSTPTITNTPQTPGTSTATATITNTPVTPPTQPTATATHTVPPTASATATNTAPTPTRTGNTPTPTTKKSSDDDGCNIVAPDSTSGGGTLALLFAPALLLWARRRRL